MKKILVLLVITGSFFMFNCSAGTPGKEKKDTAAVAPASGKVVHLTTAEFKEKVFDYSASKTWKYKGALPCIVDFYADWCGPCRMMSPRLEEVAAKYAGKLVVYKIDTDKEQELSNSMGIQSLPTLLLCPMNGEPHASMGVISKESLEKAIHDALFIP